ncbi:MAG: putative metal-binding motif-containing protein [Sandaracinaceae bacterium]|nr:putative metal-binding motif-containing protein [Sandaracinaceae bacterium]
MRSVPFRLRVGVLAFALVGAGFGCGDGPAADTDGSVADGSIDAPGFDFGTPDMGTTCTTNEECDDDISCTRDLCDRGYCRNSIDLSVCADDVFCNGVEQCDLVRGCIPGPPEACNDDDVCTLDACDEPSKSCMHAPRDFDEDGEADWHCEGGTDCDDRNPSRGMDVAEICGDTVDNNCNESVDEMPCGRPANDDCSDPLDISAGGTFTTTTIGTTPDFTVSCGSTGWKDVVATFTLTEAHDVQIEGSSSTAVVSMSLRSTCDGGTETECASGFPGLLRRRNLAAGTYFVVISTSSPSAVVVTAAFTDPTSNPTNETCTAPTDVSAGGHFLGSFVDVTNDLSLSCNAGIAPDLVYTFTIDTQKDVAIRATSPTADTIVTALRSTCAGTDLRCTGGAPLATNVHSLDAGTYFIVLEGPSYTEIDFDLEVVFSEPTAPPAGDTCGSAIPLTLGMTTLGVLSDKEDDLAISCGYQHGDAIYSFTLSETQDVTVVVDGATRYMNAAITPTCGGATSAEIRCSSGSPSRSRLRSLGAGTYYVVVESYGGSSFQISVDATDPTPLTPATGNDICGTAVTIPETGGFYSGDTSGLNNDYTGSCGSSAESKDAAFVLVLTSSKHVVASTTGSAFDSVLLLQSAPCGTGREIECDDDDAGEGGDSLIERTLEAGTYYFIVDGFGTGNAGAYFLEVVVTDP